MPLTFGAPSGGRTSLLERSMLPPAVRLMAGSGRRSTNSGWRNPFPPRRVRWLESAILSSSATRSEHADAGQGLPPERHAG
jgi:hypothetical protein